MLNLPHLGQSSLTMPPRKGSTRSACSEQTGHFVDWDISLRLELWEEDDVADAFLAEEHHAQAVNADTDTASGWHSMFEGDEEIFVELLLLAAGLMLQRGALRDGILLLGVAG